MGKIAGAPDGLSRPRHALALQADGPPDRGLEQAAPVHEAAWGELGGAPIVHQRLRVRARRQLCTVHELHQRTHDAVQLGHLRVPPAHGVPLCLPVP